MIDAFLAGMEQAKANGHDLSQLASVASFFVSRVDTEIDKRLEKIGPRRQGAEGQGGDRQRPAGVQALRGEVRLASGGGRSRGRRETAAAAVGLHGTKNPGYKDTIYVEELVAPGVVNTMPEETFNAYADHGETRRDTVAGSTRPRSRCSATWPRSGSTSTTWWQVLESEGVDKFEAAGASCSRA